LNFYELKINLFSKFELDYKKSLEPLSKIIASITYKSKNFKTLHSDKEFKYYTISNLMNLQNSNFYKRGQNYFLLRTPNKEFINEIALLLFNYEDDFFKIESLNMKEIKFFNVTKLYTINPTIVSFKDNNNKVKQWTIESNGDILFLLENLHKNLVKKYNFFYNKNINPKENFIKNFKLLNQKPISIYYTKNKKEFRLFGNKFEIVPKQDEFSQQLAFLALSCGLGEKNALGGGFCLGG